MSKRESDAVAKVLSDPENSERSAEEVAQAVIDCLDDVRLRAGYPRKVGDMFADEDDRSPGEIARDAVDLLEDIRSKTHRLAVVGQISFPEAPETVHTVVLGPFPCRGTLDTQEKFLRALEDGSAARTAGQDLYVDPKNRLGKGRFMLAPAFSSPRQAWEFFRPAEPDIPKRFAWIGESIRRWEAGASREAEIGPVCHCGTREREHQTSAGPVSTGPCPVHGREAR